MNQLSDLKEHSTLINKICELRNLFEKHFNQTWFAIIIDDLPIKLKDIREIQDLIYLETLYTWDIKEIYRRIIEFEGFLQDLQTYLLPILKEKLGISNFTPKMMIKDRDQYVIRQFIAYTLPYNIERLVNIIVKIKQEILNNFVLAS